jgi:arsenate reductase
MMLKIHDHEMVLLYDRESRKGKQTLAYLIGLTPNVRDIDLMKESLSPSYWKEILKRLALRPKDLMDKSNPYYQEHIRGRDFDTESWLKVLSRNPALIRCPIVLSGKKAMLGDNPSDVLKITTISKTSEKVQ